MGSITAPPFMVDSISPVASKFWSTSMAAPSSASNSSTGSCYEEMTSAHLFPIDSSANCSANSAPLEPTNLPFPDFTPKTNSVCVSCRSKINDRYILKLHPNLEFHASCLKCYQCQRPLDENASAFVKDSNTYCKEDYFRLFGTKCTRCEVSFSRNDYVLKGGSGLYHTTCFCCCGCGTKLACGERYILVNDMMFCKSECVEPFNGHQIKVESDEWDVEGRISDLGHLGSMSTPPLSIKSSLSEDSILTPITRNNIHDSGVHESGSSTSSTSGKKGKKDKQKTRVRTVLNENQLKILKNFYQHNNRPDSATKERMAELTGLSIRCLRIWFQNKRCKDKKRQVQMTAMAQAQEKERAINGVRMNGVGPLVAPSPTTHHDPNLQGILAVEIRQYSTNNIWETPGMAMQPPPYHPGPHQMMASHMSHYGENNMVGEMPYSMLTRDSDQH